MNNQITDISNNNTIDENIFIPPPPPIPSKIERLIMDDLYDNNYDIYDEMRDFNIENEYEETILQSIREYEEYEKNKLN